MKKTTVLISVIVSYVLFVVPAFVSADTCSLHWTDEDTGQTFSEPTTETSRTPGAAYQLYNLLDDCSRYISYPPGGSNEPDFDGTCYEDEFSFAGLYFRKLVCTTGTWSEYFSCFGSPGCPTPYCNAGGTWDVVCGPQSLISLASFEATPGSGRVVLEWETESETDNAGFNLFRSGPGDVAYIQINDALIPAEGSPTRGAVYRFVDTDVANRTTYSYLLEDVDLNGQATQHEPVSAMPKLLYGLGW